jgi:hypothetical protein
MEQKKNKRKTATVLPDLTTVAKGDATSPQI